MRLIIFVVSTVAGSVIGSVLHQWLKSVFL